MGKVAMCCIWEERVTVGTWEERITWKGHVEKYCSLQVRVTISSRPIMHGLQGNTYLLLTLCSFIPLSFCVETNEPTAVVHEVKSP